MSDTLKVLADGIWMGDLRLRGDRLSLIRPVGRRESRLAELSVGCLAIGSRHSFASRQHSWRPHAVVLDKTSPRRCYRRAD